MRPPPSGTWSQLAATHVMAGYNEQLGTVAPHGAGQPPGGAPAGNPLQAAQPPASDVEAERKPVFSTVVGRRR